jgi:uncharacterized RDD family membrane protein YckC
MAEAGKPWPGFWRKLGAFVIDGLILGIAGYLLGFVAFDQLVAIGPWGHLVGLGIGMAYFGILTSALGGGRTLGHRVLGMRVAALDGRRIDLPRALARALVLVIPLALNGFYMSASGGPADVALGVALIVAVFGVGLAQLYLLLFGGPDRRLLHDLVAATMVVRSNTAAPHAPKGSVHHLIAPGLVALILAAVVGALLFAPSIIPASLRSTFSKMSTPMRSVSALPDVGSVEVADSVTQFYGTNGSSSTRALVVTAHYLKRPAEKDRELNRVAQKVLDSYTFAPGQRLTVRLSTGYQLGIASSVTTEIATWTPEQWRARIAAAR